MKTITDHVQRETFVRGSIERVFAALTDPSLFPTWGPEHVEGKIAPGERPVFDFGFGGKCAVYIVAVEAPRYFAYRWKQGEYDPAVLLQDPLAGPNTLVEFRLESRDGGTRVQVTESEIDKLPHMAKLNVEEAQAGLDNMGKGWELMLGGLPHHFAFAGGTRVENERDLAAPRARVHALLKEPSQWWMGVQATDLDISSTDDRTVNYRWKRDGGGKQIELHLDDTPTGTHLRQTETGFATERDAKRAHQTWGVILGMLEMAVAGAPHSHTT